MICPRHGAIASKHDDQGWPLCEGCFREAVTKAEDILLEEAMRAIYARYQAMEPMRIRVRWEP